ncbi:dihydrodipicolinate reductase-like protein CRR1, chloroplastic [Populus alba]|uniref:dihydrodipicolinate reductase-like protein CRR1, chloroplastic n=1 Tax=Populus alba TaxID=43335 RepID=UPI00158D3F0D|nr:dihydrodipicolinate reductase-like protein CRR1, chloroplastic [Populus alba]
MEVACAVDSHFVGDDIGTSKETGVAVDFADPSIVYDKGCLIAPTVSIVSLLLQQAAIAASFHYNNAEIVESRSNPIDFPSMDAIQISKNLSNMGQIYEDIARGQVLGEDGDRVYSMVLPGLPYSAAIYFSGPGVVYSIKHDISDLKCLKPGLILAIRKVIRLKNLVYGLEKLL